MSTLETIKPIIYGAYGQSPMAEALAENLAHKIDSGQTGRDGTREDLIWRVCWDWMSGGDTAQSVAKRIEEALS